jgi:hypothetical protein
MARKQAPVSEQISIAEMERVVRAAWEKLGLQSLQEAGFVVLPTMTKRTMIEAAYAFTVAHAQKVAELEGECNLLLGLIILLRAERGDMTAPIYKRTLQRLETALAQLKIGWRGMEIEEATYGK